MKPIEPRELAVALLRRGGAALLAAAAMGWWAVHLDGVTRAERAAAEASFRIERAEDRREWTKTLQLIAEGCLHERRVIAPGGRPMDY